MRHLILIFFLSCFLSGCDYFNSKPEPFSGKDHPEFEMVRKSIKAYNNFDLEGYVSYFDKDVEVFVEQGLGRIRLYSGLEQLKGHYKPLFEQKNALITNLDEMRLYPWIFVHQKIDTKKRALEAVVGYKIVKGKIKDVMIMAEKEFDNP